MTRWCSCTVQITQRCASPTTQLKPGYCVGLECQCNSEIGQPSSRTTESFRSRNNNLPYVDAGTFENWGREESAPLAVSVAYDGGKLLKYVREEGAYQLTAEYIATAKATADRQVTLAGYRIAEVLVRLLGSQSVAAAKQ